MCSLLGNLKAALSGAWHATDPVKQAHRHLGEFAYRFKRRFDLAALAPRLLRAAVTTNPQPPSVLRVSEAGH